MRADEKRSIPGQNVSIALCPPPHPRGVHGVLGFEFTRCVLFVYLFIHLVFFRHIRRPAALCTLRCTVFHPRPRKFIRVELVAITVRVRCSTTRFDVIKYLFLNARSFSTQKKKKKFRTTTLRSKTDARRRRFTITAYACTRNNFHVRLERFYVIRVIFFFFLEFRAECDVEYASTLILSLQ